MTRQETALKKHKENGFNCSQCVGTVFADILHMEESQIFQMTSAFGYGMGGMQGTCGAVSAAILIIGMLMNDGDMTNIAQKPSIHKAAKEFSKRFIAKNQSIVCYELKGVKTGTMLRSCDGCITDAIDILEEMIEEGWFQKA